MEINQRPNAYSPPSEGLKVDTLARLEHVQAAVSDTKADIGRLTEKLATLERERDYLLELLTIWEPDQWERRGKMFVNRGNGMTMLEHGSYEGGGEGVSIVSTYKEHPADLVVKLLEELQRPLHYREIENELRERGWYAAGGADPANTLLAKYFKDERLYRPAKGVYALRPARKTVRSVGTRGKARQRTRRSK